MSTHANILSKVPPLLKNKQVYSTTTSCTSDNFNGGFMHVIHMLYMGIQKHLETVLSAHNQISFSQFVILVGFSSSDTLHITQAKLADQLMLTEATVSRHIHSLVEKKLLRKEKDASNKKSYNVSLTQQGLKTFLGAKEIIMNELDSLFKHISEKDRQTIIKNFTTTIETLQRKK